MTRSSFRNLSFWKQCCHFGSSSCDHNTKKVLFVTSDYFSFHDLRMSSVGSLLFHICLVTSALLLTSTVSQFLENSPHFPRHPKSSQCHHCPKLLWNRSFQNFPKCEHVLGCIRIRFILFLFYFHKKNYAWCIHFDMEILMIFYWWGWDGIYWGYGIATAVK